jgi:hypothetical protein
MTKISVQPMSDTLSAQFFHSIHRTFRRLLISFCIRYTIQRFSSKPHLETARFEGAEEK